MKKMIFATKNAHKMVEIKMILKDLGLEILSQEEAGIDLEVVEDGKTFEENALKKAVEICQISGEMVMADDSGLEIDYLNKEPGVYSARYLGKDTPYIEKNKVILERLEGVEEEKRTARFVCAIAVAFPDGETHVLRGTIEGIIGYSIDGENGFGYDPIFYVPEAGKTTAAMTADEKNEISHRGVALKEMKAWLAAQGKI